MAVILQFQSVWKIYWKQWMNTLSRSKLSQKIGGKKEWFKNLKDISTRSLKLEWKKLSDTLKNNYLDIFYLLNF